MLHRFETGPQTCFVTFRKTERHMTSFAWGGEPAARRPDKGRSPKSRTDVRGQKPMRGLKLRGNVTDHEKLTACQPRNAIGGSLDIVHEHARSADLVGYLGFLNDPRDICKVRRSHGDRPSRSDCSA